MPNLVLLYTLHGPVMIDTDQWNSACATLTAYTLDGHRKIDVDDNRHRLLSSQGVYRESLYASQALAQAEFDRLVAKMRKQHKDRKK